MCIIAVKSKGSPLPKEEHLRNCEIRNKDGIGIALLKDGKSEIQIKKDFKNVNDFIPWFYANVTEMDTCIVHYRYATHGLVDIGNRHPFPITKNKEMLRQPEVICQIAMAHNGVISQYGAHAKFSDTQKFVLDILSDETVKQNLDNPAVQKLISNFLAGDRLAIMLADGTIWMWGEWVEEGSVKYSNDGYKQEKIVTTHWKSDVAGFIDNCEVCGEKKYLQATEETHYFSLCKACRKKLRKGKLETIGGMSVKELDEQAREVAMYYQNKSSWEMKNDKDVLPDVQCESCYNWIDKNEILNKYGAKICQRCLNDVTYMENPSINDRYNPNTKLRGI